MLYVDLLFLQFLSWTYNQCSLCTFTYYFFYQLFVSKYVYDHRILWTLLRTYDYFFFIWVDGFYCRTLVSVFFQVSILCLWLFMMFVLTSLFWSCIQFWVCLFHAPSFVLKQGLCIYLFNYFFLINYDSNIVVCFCSVVICWLIVEVFHGAVWC